MLAENPIAVTTSPRKICLSNERDYRGMPQCIKNMLDYPLIQAGSPAFVRWLSVPSVKVNMSWFTTIQDNNLNKATACTSLSQAWAKKAPSSRELARRHGAEEWPGDGRHGDCISRAGLCSCCGGGGHGGSSQVITPPQEGASSQEPLRRRVALAVAATR